MILRHLPLARMLARRFARNGDGLEDLTQVAVIGLINAVDRFEGDRGNSFAAFAAPTIRGEIRRHLRDRGQAIRLPRRLWEARPAIIAAIARLRARHAREPSPALVAQEAGVAEDLVLDVLAAQSASRPLSLSEPDTDERPGPASWVGEEDSGFAAAEARADLDSGLSVLSARERNILHLRFARDLTQSDIAARVSLSQMHVSRLIRGAIESLRCEMGAADDAAGCPSG